MGPATANADARPALLSRQHLDVSALASMLMCYCKKTKKPTEGRKLPDVQRNVVFDSFKNCNWQSFLHLLCVDPSDGIYYTSRSCAHPRLMPFTWLKSRQMSLFTVGPDQRSVSGLLFQRSFRHFSLIFSSLRLKNASICTCSEQLSLHPRMTSKSSVILQSPSLILAAWPAELLYIAFPNSKCDV